MEYPDSRSPLQQLVVAVRVSGNKNDGPPVASEMKVHLELGKYYEHKNTGATLQQDTLANNNNNNNNKSKIKQLGTTALLIIIIPCK
jgi:hypothetical protein